MAIMYTDPFIGKLIKTLGLPKNCVSFTLTVTMDQPVLIRCTLQPNVDSEEAENITEQFELVKKDG